MTEETTTDTNETPKMVTNQDGQLSSRDREPTEQQETQVEDQDTNEDQEDTEGQEDQEDQTDDTEQEEQADDDELDTSVWGDTGTDTGNAVLKVLQDSGLKPDDAKSLLYDAVQKQDWTAIDFDALVEKMGSKAQATLVLTGVKGFISEQQARAQAVITELHDEVGSKDNWNTLVEWAKKELPQEDIDDYIALVDQGGRKARMAAKDLMERYEEAGNTTLRKDRTVVPRRGGKPTGSTVEPMSRKAYFEALDKASREGKLTDTLRNQLWKAREAGRKQGK